MTAAACFLLGSGITFAAVVIWAYRAEQQAHTKDMRRHAALLDTLAKTSKTVNKP